MSSRQEASNELMIEQTSHQRQRQASRVDGSVRPRRNFPPFTEGLARLAVTLAVAITRRLANLLMRHPACRVAKRPVVGHLYPSGVPEALPVDT